MNSFYNVSELVAIDCETTGLNPKQDRIVSIAAIRFDVSKLALDKFQKAECMVCLVNPGCSIPAITSRIHGITDDDVRNEHSFRQLAPEIRRFLGTAPIVAHNVSFDCNFLNSEFRRAGFEGIEKNKKFCTMATAAATLRLQRNTLDYVAEHFGLKRNGQFHNAYEDAMLVSQIATEFHLLERRLRS